MVLKAVARSRGISPSGRRSGTGTTGCGADKGNAIRALWYTRVREGALSSPEQINFEDVHVCGMEPAAFFAIFAQSWLTLVHWRKNFDTGHQTIVCCVTDFDGGEPHLNV